MSNTQVNGVNIFYEEKGKGSEVIALLNGVAMSTDSWIFQINELQKNFRILVHDFRGQGKSDLTFQNNTFEQHAQDLKALIDHLGITKLHIVGVSYGAEVGMYFALLYPENVRTLTLGTAVSESKSHLKAVIDSWIRAAETYDGELFFRVMAPFVYSEVFYNKRNGWLDHRAEIFGKTVTQQWLRAFISLCENFLTLDITTRLREIKVPTLVLAGEKDLLKPVSYSEIIQQEICDAQLKVIKDGGHALFLEKPTEFNEAVVDFIKKSCES